MKRIIKSLTTRSGVNSTLRFTSKSLIGVLLVAALLLMPLMPAPVALADSSPMTLTDDYKLTSDMTFSGTGFIIAVDDITLNLNGHTITGTGSGYGVDAWGRNGVTIKNGTIEGFSFGVVLEGSDNNIIKNIVVTDSTGNGISLWNDSDDNEIESCVVTNSGLGGGDFVGIIMTNGSDNNRIKDTISSNNSRYGISIRVNCVGNSLIGNTTNGNSLYGVVLSIGADNNIVKGSISNNNQQGILISGTGLASVGNSLIGNTTNGNSQNGVLLYVSADNNIVKDNTSNNNVVNGVVISNSDGNILRDNITDGNGSCGILILQGADSNEVKDNHSSNNAGIGILVGYFETVTSVDNRIIDNKLSGNTALDIWDTTTGGGTAGTANYYRDNAGTSSSPPGLVN